MAVVTGPLHSQSASGQLGKTLIYQSSRGQNVVRAYGQPNWTAHPPTAPQLAVQAFTKLIMEHWETIPTVDQATWDALAEPANISRVNAYCIENWRRHRGDEPLLDGWPDIYSTLVAGIVTPEGDPLIPDASGNYQRIADYNGKPGYKRIAAPPYWILWDSTVSAWGFDDEFGTSADWSLWKRSYSNPEGAYDQQEGGQNYPVFALS